MFGIKRKTATDMVLEKHQEELQKLRKLISDDQKRMFQLAIKTGYEWKHNKWVKRNV